MRSMLSFVLSSFHIKYILYIWHIFFTHICMQTFILFYGYILPLLYSRQPLERSRKISIFYLWIFLLLYFSLMVITTTKDKIKWLGRRVCKNKERDNVLCDKRLSVTNVFWKYDKYIICGKKRSNEDALYIRSYQIL